jgi:hypothetical protein
LGIVIGILALTVMMALIGALQTSVNDALLPLGVGRVPSAARAADGRAAAQLQGDRAA